MLFRSFPNPRKPYRTRRSTPSALDWQQSRLRSAANFFHDEYDVAKAEPAEPVIYGAVNVHSLATQDYASASPIDIAFRICAKGISAWMAQNVASKIGNELAILIADDGDKKVKTDLKQSFRQLRRQIRPPDYDPKLWYVHDDMYFGSSKGSVGIQLADLCAYFIAKHLMECRNRRFLSNHCATNF